MKTLLKFLLSGFIGLTLSFTVFYLTFVLVEYIEPSKRYDQNGHPNFVMPTLALLWSILTSTTTLIFATMKAIKLLK